MAEETASSGQTLPPGAQRFAHEAMATRFEAVLFHEDARYAEQCAHQAFQEVDRLELVLSSYIENSDVSRINNAAPGVAVRVGLDTFACLEHCGQLNVQTQGAFDVTIGALLEYWRQFPADQQPPTAVKPTPQRLAELRNATGMHQLELDPAQLTVSRQSDLVRVDLGGYGKGYAVDRMAEVLRGWEIRSALLHGGSSSVLALDPPPGERGWEAVLRHPAERDRIVERLRLGNRAMGASGLRRGNHIIDPRTGHPSTDTRAAWVVAATAATADALSTAFMVLSPEEIRACREALPANQAVLIRSEGEEPEQVLRFGDFSDL